MRTKQRNVSIKSGFGQNETGEVCIFLRLVLIIVGCCARSYHADIVFVQIRAAVLRHRLHSSSIHAVTVVACIAEPRSHQHTPNEQTKQFKRVYFSLIHNMSRCSRPKPNCIALICFGCTASIRRQFIPKWILSMKMVEDALYYNKERLYWIVQ